jgi:HAD superfamily hydrolase (TIGR01549 family)
MGKEVPVFPVTRTRWVSFGCYGTLVRGDLDIRDEVRLFDDVEPMLAALRRRGYRLAVLTNGNGRLFELTHRRFRVPFDLFVTADRILGLKPAPWHFRAFELMTRVRKDDWVHVASSLRTDIAPAQALGIRTVWLNRDAVIDVPGSVDTLFQQDWATAEV